MLIYNVLNLSLLREEVILVCSNFSSSQLPSKLIELEKFIYLSAVVICKEKTLITLLLTQEWKTGSEDTIILYPLSKSFLAIRANVKKLVYWELFSA
jgi:hypothetical protein